MEAFFICQKKSQCHQKILAFHLKSCIVYLVYILYILNTILSMRRNNVKLPEHWEWDYQMFWGQQDNSSLVAVTQ